ncbi:hypothetical protein HOLleu_00225 [Holothuria leucospilota]|uniref:Uncharacterized protein n=1 Tax=Holothuria leucospilota TaxID=206669 RepID=A0A9Q1HIK5_HOLLE|nr:hypothetical protein HOLleu_00225 [Holothuria leucospilota]
MFNAQMHPTIAVALIPADDSMSNLKLGLQDHWAQLGELQEKLWNHKKLRLFLFGDYECLC